MAVPTLVATAGAATANSYATVAQSTTYHESHLYGSAWTNADTDSQTIALIMATRLLDAMIEWTGSPTTPDTQSLRWPRVGMYDRDDNLLDSAAIPDALRDATSEFARQLIVADRTVDNEIESSHLTSLTAGPVSMTFGSMSAKVIPDAVWALLIPSWGTKKIRSGGAIDLMRA